VDKLDPSVKLALINGIIAGVTGNKTPPKPMTADDVNDDTYDVVLRPGKFITLRRADPITLFMTGAMSASLQATVERAHQRLNSLNEPNESSLLDIPEDERSDMVDTMREYVIAVAVDPQFTLDINAEPHKADVRKLLFNELLTIFRAVPTGLKYPRLQGVQAESFRPVVQPADAQAAPAGPSVSSPAVRLASVGGREVETIGA
jgi:hypothetical protein